MPFDFQAAIKHVATTFEYEVLDPFTKKPSGWIWTLATPANAEATAKVRTLTDKIRARRGVSTLDQAERDLAERLVCLSLGWRGLEDCKKEVPFTPEAALACISGPSTFWLREQIMEALSDPENAFRKVV